MIIIGMVLFEGMTQLDLTGPLEVFSRMPETTIHLISKTLDAVKSDSVLSILPTTTFQTCPEKLTILFIPGGPGISGVLDDPAYLNFIRSKDHSSYITSVCTGSIVLAACGLLNGYRATTHWFSMDLLAQFGVQAMNERVVIDRNRITGGGVTSGIDFALSLANMLFGETRAQTIQLSMEYNPRPPFNAGHPDVADASLVKTFRQQRAESQQRRREQISKFIAQK
jgi:cyclohexyl-isocyanide hydratase